MIVIILVFIFFLINFERVCMNKIYTFFLVVSLGIASNALCMEGQRPDESNNESEAQWARLTHALVQSIPESEQNLRAIYCPLLHLSSDASESAIGERIRVFEEYGMNVPGSVHEAAIAGLRSLLTMNRRAPERPQQRVDTVLNERERDFSILGVPSTSSSQEIDQHYAYLEMTGQMNNQISSAYRRLVALLAEERESQRQVELQNALTSRLAQNLHQATALVPVRSVTQQTTVSSPVVHQFVRRTYRDPQTLAPVRRTIIHRRIRSEGSITESVTDLVPVPVPDTHPNFLPQFDNSSTPHQN